MRSPWPTRLALFLVTACLSASPASAELYRWVDESGREHFTSDPHQVPPEQRRGAAWKPQDEKIQRVESYDADELQEQRRKRRARLRREAERAVASQERHRRSSDSPPVSRVRRTPSGLDLDKEPTKQQKYRYSCPDPWSGSRRRCKRIQTQEYREWKALQPPKPDDDD